MIPTRSRIGVALLAVTLAALSACSSGDDQQVASVSGSTTGSDDAGLASTDGIGDFVDCLVAGGVPALVGEDGELAFPEDKNVMISNGDEGTMLVEVDGEDVSETWTSCEAQHPDVEPFPDPENMSAEEVAAQNQAGTEWATCARAAGFSDIADPQDGSVTLPTSLTAERAAALGQACPIDDFGPFGLATADIPEESMDGIFAGLFGTDGSSTVVEQD